MQCDVWRRCKNIEKKLHQSSTSQRWKKTAMNWDQQIGQILVMSKSAVSVLLFALVHSRVQRRWLKLFQNKVWQEAKIIFSLSRSLEM